MLELFNVTGIQVFAYKLTNGNNTITLPYEMANGVYLSRVNINGKTQKPGKLVTVR